MRSTRVGALVVAVVGGGLVAGVAAAGVHTVDAAGTVGRYSSVRIGTDGLPIISYSNAAGELRIAHCVDVECAGAAQIRIVDDENGAGRWTSLAIGNDGYAVVSYQETFNDDLKVAHCENTTCSSWGTLYADPDLDAAVGEHTSIAITPGGLPIISYYDVTNKELRVAACESVICAVPTKTAIDTSGDAGKYSSIGIGVDSLALVSYFDDATDDLRVAHCSNAACTAATSSPIDTTGSVGDYTAILAGYSDYAFIAYRDITNGSLKAARCADLACTSASSTTTVDEAANDVGRFVAVAHGQNGKPLISYWDLTNGLLKLARCRNEDCTEARVSALAYGGTLGGYTSIAVDAKGHPVISFYDAVDGDLRVAYPGLHSDGFEAGNFDGWEAVP